MNTIAHRRLTGLLLILGAVLVNVPYTLLILNFDYPTILREPAGTVLTQFQAGGSGLIFTWLAFAWSGLPVLAALVLVHKLVDREDTPYLSFATVMGVIGGVAQMVGLLRWAFVVPGLAAAYTDPQATEFAKEAAVLVFQTVHQFGGVVLGEHIGQSFTIVWMVLTSLAMLKSRLFSPWLGWLGFVASLVYALAQTELLATVVPGFPVVPQAGLYGSLLWLVWMASTGVFLLVRRNAR
jgi:hypothetical protein